MGALVEPGIEDQNHTKNHEGESKPPRRSWRCHREDYRLPVGA
jgi:hypothetical protein